MPQHARKTKVSPRDSRSDIEDVLRLYGATAFMYATKGSRALLAFEYQDRRYRLSVTLPDREQFRYTPGRGLERAESAIDTEHQQAIRQRWRALLLVIRALLEADEAGIITLEESLLSYMVVRDRETGQETTVGEELLPHLAQIASTGHLPALLPDPGHRRD